MKKYKITVCMAVLAMTLSGCRRHIETYEYKVNQSGNINSKISDCMVIDIKQPDYRQSGDMLQYYEKCSLLDIEPDKVSQVFEIPKDDIYINDGIVYYNKDEFNTETYVPDENVTEEVSNITNDGFVFFSECLNHFDINICDRYDTRMMRSENGDEIYYIKMYQEQNNLKIYDGIHGMFENRSMVFGTYIEIYFDKNNIYRLTINNVINIGKGKSDKEIAEVSEILDRIIYTYGRIISSDTYTIKNVEIQYTAFRDSDNSMQLKPVWVVECDISQKNGTVYSINILYDGYTGREVI